MGKILIIFGVNNSSFVNFDGKEKNISILGGYTMQSLDYSAITAEARYPANFTESGKIFVLSLHYSRSNSFVFVNAVKMYQFKTKESEMKPYPLCLGNISKDFIISNMKKKKIKMKSKDFFCWL